MTKSETLAGKPPLREQRETCWKLRDEYFSCLETLSVFDPAKVDTDELIKTLVKKSDCWKKKSAYENACMTSWVDYFNKRRTLEIRQRQIADAKKRSDGESESK
ncbi:5195_t:CDS:2 [Gigaspora margarita]|uniref:Cytochrome c oxidase, subunit VIb n=2 Tax=Gigaspora margarita TaxID=4874 RepID=A0A8H4A9S7_GIGMA|nr:cytochrome c oxidase, subunit VIb [Gigaspora margarita]CAG8492909.1 5195_t:CDS:2 [Gigaspora margarita]